LGKGENIKKRGSLKNAGRKTLKKVTKIITRKGEKRSGSPRWCKEKEVFSKPGAEPLSGFLKKDKKGH